jgi:predicted Fe-Mo cluster-binding NifX family protein
MFHFETPALFRVQSGPFPLYFSKNFFGTFIVYPNRWRQTMRVGIPVFGDQVAPRFEYAQDFLIVDMNIGASSNRRLTVIVEPEEKKLPAFCKQFGINVLICCGITQWCRQVLKEKGVEVISGVMSSSDSALESLRNGKLVCEQYVPDQIEDSKTQK